VRQPRWGDKEAILDDLISLKVDWAKIYPDLDGVAKALRLRYGLQ